MFRTVPLLLPILALILSACAGAPQTPLTPATGSAVTPTAEASTASLPTEAISPSPTAVQAALPSPSAAPVEASGPANCTVVSPRPTPGPTEQSLFPPPGEADWIVGPENAAVTIIEYSDFQ